MKIEVNMSADHSAISFDSITTIDTAIATHNVGDEIIMRAVDSAIFETFPSGRIARIPSHEKISKTSLSIVRHSDYAILGGSNILSSYMNKYRQWKIDLLDALLIKGKVVTLGVGWRNYQGSPNAYTRFLLKNLLHPSKLHSVRDSYTEKGLRDLGFENVINTGCPTMWKLTPDHCRNIPSTPSAAVVITLTDYDPDKERDGILIDTVRSSYKDVSFWVQGKRDLEYFYSFGNLVKDINIIPPNLSSYDNFLDSHDSDYVGTRLHGGIRAMQKGKRTIIVGIDNRAKEKRTDFNLPVIDREKIAGLKSFIQNPFETSLRIPFEKINQWKSQFHK